MAYLITIYICKHFQYLQQFNSYGEICSCSPYNSRIIYLSLSGSINGNSLTRDLWAGNCMPPPPLLTEALLGTGRVQLQHQLRALVPTELSRHPRFFLVIGLRWYKRRGTCHPTKYSLQPASRTHTSLHANYYNLACEPSSMARGRLDILQSITLHI
jgi:hypothetical protein